MGNKFDLTGFENDKEKVLSIFEKAGTIFMEYKKKAPSDEDDNFLELFERHADIFSRKLADLLTEHGTMSYFSLFGMVVGAEIDSLLSTLKNALDTYSNGIRLAVNSSNYNDAKEILRNSFYRGDGLMKEFNERYKMTVDLLEENLAS